MKRLLITLLALIGVHQHLSAQQKTDLVNAAGQIAPGAGASVVAQAWGWSPANILTYLSVTFMLLQIAYLVWKWRRQAGIDAANKAVGKDPGPTSDWGKS